MHSKIFQISKKKVEPCDFIIEDDYYGDGQRGYFVGSIADYTDSIDEEYWPAIWESLGRLPGITYNDMLRTITITSKKEYFEDAYRTFMDALSRVSKATIEEFASGKYTGDLNDIRWAFDDEYGYYVDDSPTDSEVGLLTFDEFVRFSNDGDTFYLGAIVDYHW